MKNEQPPDQPSKSSFVLSREKQLAAKTAYIKERNRKQKRTRAKYFLQPLAAEARRKVKAIDAESQPPPPPELTSIDVALSIMRFFRRCIDVFARDRRFAKALPSTKLNMGIVIVWAYRKGFFRHKDLYILLSSQPGNGPSVKFTDAVLYRYLLKADVLYAHKLNGVNVYHLTPRGMTMAAELEPFMQKVGKVSRRRTATMKRQVEAVGYGS